MQILIPLMRALVAEHNLSLASGIKMSTAVARALWLICHGVSYALIGRESSQPEAHCQARRP